MEYGPHRTGTDMPNETERGCGRTKQGDQQNQGIGYLEDGTMIVVEQGRSVIGQDVAITVTSVLQTPAGRMIFGRLGPSTGSAEHNALPPGK